MYLATLTPFDHALGPDGNPSPYFDAPSEAKRQQVNAWVRANTAKADCFIDFDAELRDPNAPSKMLTAYDICIRTTRAIRQWPTRSISRCSGKCSRPAAAFPTECRCVRAGRSRSNEAGAYCHARLQSVDGDLEVAHTVGFHRR